MLNSLNAKYPINKPFSDQFSVILLRATIKLFLIKLISEFRCLMSFHVCNKDSISYIIFRKIISFHIAHIYMKWGRLDAPFILLYLLEL